MKTFSGNNQWEQDISPVDKVVNRIANSHSKFVTFKSVRLMEIECKYINRSSLGCAILEFKIPEVVVISTLVLGGLDLDKEEKYCNKFQYKGLAVPPIEFCLRPLFYHHTFRLGEEREFWKEYPKVLLHANAFSLAFLRKCSPKFRCEV